MAGSLLEMYERVGGQSTRSGRASRAELTRAVKPQLEKAFQRGDLVAIKMPGFVFLKGAQGLVNRIEKPEAGPEQRATRSKNENDEHVIEFILESDDSKYVYPFHHYKLYNEDGKEIASGKTDENGRAVVKVEKEADYYVEIDPAKTHKISGKVLQRGSHEPFNGAAMEAVSNKKVTYPFNTGRYGEFKLDAVGIGELVFKYKQCEYTIYVDGDHEELVVYMPRSQEKRDEAKDEGNEADYYDAGPWDDFEINVDEY
jgi:hypothetical protein